MSTTSSAPYAGGADAGGHTPLAMVAGFSSDGASDSAGGFAPLELASSSPAGFEPTGVIQPEGLTSAGIYHSKDPAAE